MTTRALLSACAASVAVASSVAGVPELQRLFPAGAARGVERAVTMSGTAVPWPPQIWVDGGGLRFEADEKEKTFRVRVAPDANIGPRLVRLYNAEGASAPVLFLIGKGPERDEIEPNNRRDQAERVDGGSMVVHGRLEKDGDVDCFRLWLEAGETAVARLDAFSLGSGVDALFRLTDIDGRVLAFNHDHIHFDPFLAWTARRTGIHTLQVMGFDYPAKSDIRLGGGPEAVYRLHLHRGPWIAAAVPATLRRGESRDVAVFGWGLAETALPAIARGGAAALTLNGGAQPGGQSRVPVVDYREIVEREPNDDPAQAQAISVPGAGSGRVDHRRDQDRYQFYARPGTAYALAAASAGLGFKNDLWLAIEGEDGQEKARVDDSDGRPDPRLEWRPDTAGVYHAVVGANMPPSTPFARYRLTIEPIPPQAAATTPAHTLSIAPGATNEIPIRIERKSGHASGLTLAAIGLPPGLSAAAVSVGNEDASATMKVIAAQEAAPWNGPIQIQAIDREAGTADRVRAPLVSSSVKNGVPQGFPDLLIKSVDALWLTVTPAKKEDGASAAGP